MKPRLLVLSTPVAPLGAGPEGGVRLVVSTLARELPARGFDVRVLAPRGSRLDGPGHIDEVDGALHPSAALRAPETPPMLPEGSVLAAMCARAQSVAERGEVDLVLNLAYDPLPYELALDGALGVPVAHFVSMASLSRAMHRLIGATAVRFPGSVAMQTAAQAATFALSPDVVTLVSGGVEIERYHFRARAASDALAWAGRIAPEKGVDDALQAASLVGAPLHVMGALQDETYWQAARASAPGVDAHYLGFLPTERLQAEVGRCRALLVTPKWEEAFGLVVAEALACGVPVIAYRRGGPAEIVRHSQTGFLVEPDDIQGLAAAIRRLDEIDRSACRAQAERELSARAFADRVADWLLALVN